MLKNILFLSLEKKLIWKWSFLSQRLNYLALIVWLTHWLVFAFGFILLSQHFSAELYVAFQLFSAKSINNLKNFHRLFIHTAQKMKFSMKDFFSKCEQIRRKLRIRSHLLKKSLMKNFIFCAVSVIKNRG